ncbi:hypothetical protein HJC23_002019 [Cyclotella cryptica]|uniref:1-phosphatidylinositol 4-kinase n=1 Tax=Cyclotella cryptica TaxID=29204 RepID=A0ABD3NUR9_9STRA|eukprot:CCRYP_019823-RA/>CCRYP_019823-RA protein AED:0.02 eAED:0.02 QI:318/1/1/1/1/1/4/55/1376
MFLLPAIGAWVSDGIILYIHFVKGGSSTSQPVAFDLEKNNYDLYCGSFGTTNCRRLKTIEGLFSNFSDIEEVSDVSSFPVAVLNETVGDSILFGSDNVEDESSSSVVLSSDSDEPQQDRSPSDKNESIGISVVAIESSTGYLALLAIVRLVLLSLPLSYAAFYGTRVICLVGHYIFEGGSAMVVVGHMMAILILNPSSFSIKSNAADPVGDSAIDGMGGVDDSLFENAWALLTLSLVSILLHFLIVLHVRSTGPATQDWLYEERKRKRKRMAYAIAARNHGFRGKGLGSNDMIMVSGDHGSDQEEEGADETPLLLPGGNGLSEDKNLSNNSRLSFNSDHWRERFRCLPEQYEVFISEAQARLDAARRMWMSRLEDASHGQEGVRDATDIENGEFVSSPLSAPTSILSQAIHSAATNATQLQTKLGRPDPFKVLLQLFAYEDVWTNHRLDLAFSCEQTNRSNAASDTSGVSDKRRAALSFYAPQLLSFLLHGAYFDISSKLEEWVLKQCSRDLHFAHRCFWFLRAWCLGSQQQKPSHNRIRSGGSLGELNGSSFVLDPTSRLNARSEVAFNQLRGSETNLYLSYCQGLLAGSRYQNYSSKSNSSIVDMETSYLRFNSDGTSEGLAGSSPSKFSHDERVLIEELLQRVIKQGSKPATKAQYGGVKDNIRVDIEVGGDFANSPSALATAVEKGLVPIDPRTGFHSTQHLDCITSPQKYGFLPLNNSGEPYQEKRQACDAVSLFLSAPMFLDALLSIADDLMDVPKANRTVSLRQRLQSLEVELLPSNVVYLPIGLGNMQHRVWRIVSDESLALSTNERVPCIVTLEVIDYAYTDPTSSNVSDDSAITLAWVNDPRPPKRHSTLIDKMAKYTQEGLRRLDDHFSQHGDGKSGVIERRRTDFMQQRNESWKKYSPVQLVESVDEGDDASSCSHDEEAPAENGHRDDHDGLLFELCPPPPLGGSPSPLHEPCDEIPPLVHSATDDDEIKLNAVQASPLDAPQTPTKFEKASESSMGQWSTPTSARKPSVKLRKRMNFIGEISEEDSDDNSPQAKQRKRIAIPPSSKNIQRSDSAPVEVSNPALANGPAPTVVFKEDWKTKTERLRNSSVYGSHDGWRLLPILIKSNDDLRQEQLASQLIQRMALILAKANIPVWLYPYEIVALTGRGGIIECVPDTISIDSLKRNDPDFTDLKSFYTQHFGSQGSNALCNAKANFVESLAAYSIVCFLMQIKDRHNGNILLDNKGHIIHIDFGFYFLSSPGKNSGFESAPFKLTRDFVSLMDGPDSRTFAKFRELCYKTFIELRKNCYQITLLVEMLMEGNEDLACFRGTPEEAVRGLKERFRLDLNDMACLKYVDSLIDESLENWRTRWYDRYQRFCVGVM